MNSKRNQKSYFDWQLSFRKKTDQLKKENSSNIPKYSKLYINSLGISDKYFKDFMRNWKLKNL